MKSQKIDFKVLLLSLPLMVVLVTFVIFALPYWKLAPSILAGNTGITSFNYAYSTAGFIIYCMLSALLLFSSMILVVKVLEVITGKKIIKTKEERMAIKRKIEYVDINLSWFTKVLIFLLVLLLSILIYVGVVNV